MGRARTAAMASTFSATEIGRPMVRSSATKAASVARPAMSALRGQFGRRLLDVRLVLEQDMERVGGELRRDLLRPEQVQRAGQVEGFRDRRPLLEVHRPQG